MNTNTKTAQYAAPPKPPLSVRLDKFKQFFMYEIRRSWKTRTAAFIVFSLTLSMLWWVYAVRTPYIMNKQNNQLTPEVFHKKIQALEDKIASLEADATTTALQLLEQSILNSDASFDMQNQTLEEVLLDISEQHIVNNYAGISELLESVTEAAYTHHLTLTYQLEKPTPSHLLYSDDLADVLVQIQLIPDPTIKASQIWNHVMQQIHYMVMEEKKFSLLSIHISTSNQHMNLIELQLNMLVALDEIPVEPNP